MGILQLNLQITLPVFCAVEKPRKIWNYWQRLDQLKAYYILGGSYAGLKLWPVGCLFIRANVGGWRGRQPPMERNANSRASPDIASLVTLSIAGDREGNAEQPSPFRPLPDA